MQVLWPYGLTWPRSVILWNANVKSKSCSQNAALSRAAVVTRWILVVQQNISIEVVFLNKNSCFSRYSHLNLFRPFATKTS